MQIVEAGCHFKNAVTEEYDFWWLSQTSVTNIDVFKRQWEKSSSLWYLIGAYVKEDNKDSFLYIELVLPAWKKNLIKPSKIIWLLER